jgi:Tfp pilus assembly protein PilF
VIDKRQKALNLIQRAYQAQNQGRLKEATELYESSLTIHPTAEAYTFLGWTYSLQGNLEGAIALCRRAIEMDPDLGNPYSDIGAYLIQLHRYQEATDWLRKASRARRYACLYSAHYNLGQVFEYLGKEAQAISAYHLSLSYCSDCHQARQAYWRLISRTN